eukprot:TRINITY_DN6388_c0_g1_i2.p2 TRINITY_DN6388_c0_g1~~TRINITY_DN6388_c0_g1_i2.p2  ORF type:complete len:119 (+),score=25.21 TRINITY_DN6388_c0_g1_i2:402-758(+)
MVTRSQVHINNNAAGWRATAGGLFIPKPMGDSMYSPLCPEVEKEAEEEATPVFPRPTQDFLRKELSDDEWRKYTASPKLEEVEEQATVFPTPTQDFLRKELSADEWQKYLAAREKKCC